jgi:hypothetical protein
MKKPPVKRLKIRVYRLFSGTSLSFFFSAKEGKKLVHNFSPPCKIKGFQALRNK